jgi:hypothetical protein
MVGHGHDVMDVGLVRYLAYTQRAECSQLNPTELDLFPGALFSGHANKTTISHIPFIFQESISLDSTSSGRGKYQSPMKQIESDWMLNELDHQWSGERKLRTEIFRGQVQPPLDEMTRDKARYGYYNTATRGKW